MAFGTPVAGTVAYSAAGGTSVAPTYPASIVSTDQLVLILGQKPSTANSGTATTPSGWTLREELTGAGGYGTTLGADTGNTNLRIYTKNTVAGGESGTVPVTLATNNVSWAFILRVPTGGGVVSYGSSDGSKTAAGASVSITLAANPGLTAGDFAIWAMCIPTDVTTPGQFSAHAISAAGATFATPTELNEPDSGTGNDIGGFSAWTTVSSGTASAAPTITATAGGTTTNVRGPLALLRLREARALTLDAQPGSFSLTGQDATLQQAYVTAADAGSFAYTGQDATLTVASALRDLVLDAQPEAFVLTGQAATLLSVRSIDAQAGTLNLTGQAAALVGARTTDAQPGAFTLTGQVATLARSLATDAQPGAFTLTGQPATLLGSRVADAQPGSFAIAGQDAQLTYSQLAPELDASPGSFVISGATAALLQTHALSADAGSLAYLGQDATFERVRMVAASAGSFSLTGQDANLRVSGSPTLDAQPGALTYSGAEATFFRTYGLSAGAGSYGIGTWAVPEYVDPAYAAGMDAVLALGLSWSTSPGVFTVVGAPATLLPETAYPQPQFVKAGIKYGPGLTLTGTMVSSKAIYLFDD